MIDLTGLTARDIRERALTLHEEAEAFAAAGCEVLATIAAWTALAYWESLGPALVLRAATVGQGVLIAPVSSPQYG